MAELFLARDTKSGQLRVIKRILPYLSHEAEFVQMFLDEARIASQLDHPNIVQLHELGHLEGSIFIAMEFVDGADLRKICQEEQKHGRQVPYAAAAWITARVCDGLYYAHNRAGLDGRQLELIHRDVSPQNVMVGFDGRVKLVDFGIARANSYMERSQPGVIKGKFLYLSPEQLSHDGIDHRADLFALGAMLYEVTTGKSPFYKPTTEAVILAIRGEDPPPPHLLVRDYPLELSRIVMRCLVKDRTRRYQQASEIARDLDAFVRTQAPTDQQRVARYVAALFDTEGERTVLHPPEPAGLEPPTRPTAPIVAPGRRLTGEQPGPGAQFAGDEDEPLTQMARPRELAQAFRQPPEETASTVAPTRKVSATRHPVAAAPPGVPGAYPDPDDEATRTGGFEDEPLEPTVTSERQLPKPPPPVPEAAFFEEPAEPTFPEGEDDESTVDGSTLADDPRALRGRPGLKLLGIAAGLGLIIAAVALISFGDSKPAPGPLPAPVPVQPEPPRETAAPLPPGNPAPQPLPANPQPAEKAEASPSAVAPLTQPLEKTEEKVEVVFRAPRGTRLSAGHRKLVAGKTYRLEPGPIKVKYRCPGRRGASGIHAFEVLAGQPGAQTLTVTCRRK